MRKRRNLYISSTAISVLLHLVFFSTVAVSLKTCTAPASVATQAPPPPPESIDAEVITQQEINAYYERKQQETLAKEHALRLEKEKQERARQLAEQQKKAELLRQKKLQEEKHKQEEARLEKLRAEEQEKQRQAELRRKEQEQQQRLEAQRLAEEQKRIAEEKRRLEEAKRKQLEEEQRRLAEHRKKEQAERLKMRKQQIAIWQRQYEQMIRNDVEQRWKKPPTSIKGGECVLKIKQDQKGTILSVNFIRCEGDKLFVRSVEEAVWKASPFPTPPSADVFDSEIEFTFKRDY